MRSYHEPQEDFRRYDDTACSEVRAVFESADAVPPSHRNSAVFADSGELKNIEFDCMYCDSMSDILI